MRNPELQRIRRLRAAGRHDEYLDAVSELARAAPDDVEVRVEAAHAHARAGALDTALAHLDAAWRLGVPAAQQRGALVTYGVALCHAGRADEAVGRLGEAVAAHPAARPDDPPLKAALALALHAAGHAHAALATMLDALLEIDRATGALRGHGEVLARQRDALLDRAVAAT